MTNNNLAEDYGLVGAAVEIERTDGTTEPGTLKAVHCPDETIDHKRAIVDLGDGDELNTAWERVSRL